MFTLEIDEASPLNVASLCDTLLGKCFGGNRYRTGEVSVCVDVVFPPEDCCSP